MNQPTKFPSPMGLFSARHHCGFFALLAALACAAPDVRAQTAAPPTYDPAFVQQILKRMEAQEAELKKLRGEVARGGEAAGAPAAAKAEAFPQISFHGFGNVDYSYRNNGAEAPGKANKNSFTIGQLDFFVTSRLTENISILAEVVMEASEADNGMGIDLERILFQWKPSDYFNLDVGRYHSSVGYYNTAYHHGAWFQTATGRPRFLDFEDGGGIIPAHNIGLQFHGDIPSGSLGLGYILEVGNGRPYNQSDPGRVPNVVDDNNNKSVNLAFILRPEGVAGLQLGAGVYYDVLSPQSDPNAASPLNNVGRVTELMFHSHVIYKRGPWEWLSEGYLIRHNARGGAAHLTPAGYGQLAYKVKSWAPYARFSYINAVSGDPAWPFIGADGLRYGPSFGLRWDFSTLAALKLQYDYLYTHIHPNGLFYAAPPAEVKGWESAITAQVSFTF